MIDLIVGGAALVVFLAYGVMNGQKEALEKDLLDAINSLALHLDQGDSIESAMMEVARNKENKASKYFAQTLETTRKGHSLEESLDIVSKKSGSTIFSYISDNIKLAIGDKGGNISAALKNLSKRINMIKIMQDKLDSKSSKAITILKLFGALLLPTIYFFISAIINVPMMDYMIIYLGVVAFVMCLLDVVITGDYIGSALFFPLAAAVFYISITRIGPYIIVAFGG